MTPILRFLNERKKNDDRNNSVPKKLKREKTEVFDNFFSLPFINFNTTGWKKGLVAFFLSLCRSKFSREAPAAWNDRKTLSCRCRCRCSCGRIWKRRRRRQRRRRRRRRPNFVSKFVELPTLPHAFSFLVVVAVAHIIKYESPLLIQKLHCDRKPEIFEISFCRKKIWYEKKVITTSSWRILSSFLLSWVFRLWAVISIFILSKLCLLLLPSASETQLPIDCNGQSQLVAVELSLRLFYADPRATESSYPISLDIVFCREADN